MRGEAFNFLGLCSDFFMIPLPLYLRSSVQAGSGCYVGICFCWYIWCLLSGTGFRVRMITFFTGQNRSEVAFPCSKVTIVQ